jgi:acyl-CoA thioesterase-1
LAADPELTILCLGDSITRGVRPGVGAEQTFAALLQADLRKAGFHAKVINAGIGGEQTDGARARLARDVLPRKPQVVTVMYGTNDSYSYRGKKSSSLLLADYRANLRHLIADLGKEGIQPLLMTPPRWGERAPKNGIGEDPNEKLESYVRACREVARETKTPLVDHFALWSRKAQRGFDVGVWTTDQCHPNPEGHRVLGDAIVPVVLDLLNKNKERVK